ncbi:hypothetical protein WJX74_002825 [Apatococcus lobatus]|uniref:Uncharacterized protein n=1 Tax=Apatococcus lobatus TaxID=904363 RepID=A0AAW1RZA5_9CHLO
MACQGWQAWARDSLLAGALCTDQAGARMVMLAAQEQHPSAIPQTSQCMTPYDTCRGRRLQLSHLAGDLVQDHTGSRRAGKAIAAAHKDNVVLQRSCHDAISITETGQGRAPLKRTLTISIASGRDQGVLQQAPEMLLTPGLLHEECAWARSKDAGTGRQEVGVY